MNQVYVQNGPSTHLPSFTFHWDTGETMNWNKDAEGAVATSNETHSASKGIIFWSWRKLFQKAILLQQVVAVRN